MKKYKLPLTLVIQGPILTRSSSIGSLGVDAPMAQREFGGAKRYYLPGSLIKGLVREAWQELAVLDPVYLDYVREWLGDASDDDSNAPHRSRLVFSDFEDRKTSVEQKLRYRIHIDEETGAADAGMLQVMDTPYEARQPVRFEGEVRCLAPDDKDAGAILEAVQRGLLWVRGVGATRTSGFGQVLAVETGAVEGRPTPSAASLTTSRWDLRLTFRDPVILSKHRIADNYFESGEVVPGGALKGAVADMAQRDPGANEQLLAELHKVRFTHGFPAQAGGERPKHWPLSLIEFRDEILDAIRRKDPCIRNDEAGRFDTDWKKPTAGAVSTGYGWPQIARELRVRTAIDSKDRRARDQALFAWQTLNPAGIEWLGQVDCSTLSQAARDQLANLMRYGIEPLGKTKTLAEVALSDSSAPRGALAGPWVVTLQTPALLIDPGRHLAPGGQAGSSSERDLRAEFEAAWRELSEGSIRLVNYFQRCSLAGGEYLRRRFGGQRSQYKPFLLSDAGSTFLLEAEARREADAAGFVAAWQASGLPVSASVRDFYGIPGDLEVMWQHCPYLPENGYGEVEVNHQGPFREA